MDGRSDKVNRLARSDSSSSIIELLERGVIDEKWDILACRRMEDSVEEVSHDKAIVEFALAVVITDSRPSNKDCSRDRFPGHRTDKDRPTSSIRGQRR